MQQSSAMSAPPRLARSLANLRAEVDAQWPDRDRRSDGWIGDESHAGRVSDHNPDASGVVHALDVTAATIRPWEVVLAAVLHPATTYVIYDRRIWSRRRGFRVRPYDGADPHRSHVHVSVATESRRAESRRPWMHP